ncbi:xanthine dehydrogenase small subunit [Nocardia wallacei]|uniref:xanthine dehydrogenase small subunit n=1 Tax=Nocardia wallacei TaxID=480035 RepID=UPI002456A93F|nr:FAD binding domain-containing protein [Nocardia wallacei]
MVAARITVNGKVAPISPAAPHTTVLDFLRERGLTGSKEGCAEGECGACSILVARPGVQRPTDWVAINACLVPVAALDGQEIVTSEGLATVGDRTTLHPVQQEMAMRGGSQCGYCTPGFICSMAAEYYRPDRCAAGKQSSGAAGKQSSGAAGKQGGAAGKQGSGAAGKQDDGAAGHVDGDSTEQADSSGAGHVDGRAAGKQVAGAANHVDGEHGPNGFDLHALSGNLCRCTGYRPIRDAAFAVGVPGEDDPLARRRERSAPEAVATDYVQGERAFRRPGTLAEAVELLRERPEAMVVAGCTDWGVEVNIRARRADYVIAIDRLPELRELRTESDHLEIGAALSLTEIERRLDGSVPLLAELFPQFASRLIRNGATLGGNLGTGSPIGDSPPVLLALEASVILASADGEREVPLADYFTGYRQSVRRPGELIRAVRIPRPLSPVVAFHKIAKRRFDDISSVAVAFALDIEDGMVGKARIGLGGVAATPIRARDTEAALTGRPWSGETVDAAAAILRAEGTPMSDHRASAEYRAAMLGESLRKLYARTTEAVPS